MGPSCGATFIVRLAAALLLVLTTAGCYVTQFQVFSRKESVAVPGLDGRYIARLADEPDRVSHVTIFQERETGDYHYLVYEHFPHDPERQEVTADIPFRAVPLGSGLYVVQSCIHHKAKYSPRISCGYLFCRVVRSGDTILRIEWVQPSTDDAEVLAERDGIDMWDITPISEGVYFGLSGSPAAGARYLGDLGAVSLNGVTKGTFTRVASGGR